MAFAVAALRADGPIRILDCANVATSFPRFVEQSVAVGMDLTEGPEPGAQQSGAT